MAASHWDECPQCERFFWNDRGAQKTCSQTCGNKMRRSNTPFSESFARFLNQPETVDRRDAILVAWKRVFR